ncbi:MAG TPA: hypothetical protein VK646_09065 [Actinomycetota bacterium]|nr:hypothetical protein [Actinomycetota bacterium]
MVDQLHVCDPPMALRSASEPTEWTCPECGKDWAVVPSAPPQAEPAFDFLAHEGTVPARWVPRETG